MKVSFFVVKIDKDGRESHKENWKIKSALITQFANGYESHKENWKGDYDSEQAFDLLEESHKENWKAIIIL